MTRQSRIGPWSAIGLLIFAFAVLQIVLGGLRSLYVPAAPREAYHFAYAIPMCASAASTGRAWRGKR